MFSLFDNAILYAMLILPIVRGASRFNVAIATEIFKEKEEVRSQLSLK